MKRLFKKIATVVAAVSMVAAMATTTFAAEAPEKVYVVGAMNGWKFEEMTAVGNGVFTKTFEGVTAGDCEYKFTLQADWKDEVSSVGGGNFKTTVGDDGKLTITLDFSKLGDPVDNGGNKRYEVAEDSNAITFTAPAAGGDAADKPADKPADEAPKAGDSTAVVAVAAMAAVAGALVVVSRRQTANN